MSRGKNQHNPREEILQDLEEEMTDSEKMDSEAVKLDMDGEKMDDEAARPEEDDDKKTQEEDDINTKYLRLMADFQNFKRRTGSEKADIYARANERLVSDLLDVIDNFERALEHNAEGVGAFAEGMDMIFKQFKGVLEKVGLEEIEAQGIDFDPNIHNAVMTEDSTEYESGKVTAVLQKGYMLNKKVIRPTMVKVAN